MTPKWNLQLMGGLGCRCGETLVERFATRKAALLLIRLGLNGDSSLQRDEAALQLWPDEPVDVSRPRLRQALIAIKRSFENLEFPLVATKNEMKLDHSEVEIDCVRFEHLIRAGRNQEAISIYRPLLPGWTDSWISAYRSRFESQFVQAALRLSEESDDERAVEILTDACAVHPLNEALLAALMKRLNDSGQQARSIQVYETHVAALNASSGMGPGAALRELAQEAARANRFLESVPIPIEVKPLPSPLTRMFGREETISRLKGLIDSGRRLVTLTGIGGIGKTRIALEFARHLEGVEVVGFVPLVEIADVDLVFEAVHEALGIPSSFRSDTVETLRKAIAKRKTVLVLDSVEHLLPAASQLVQGLLASCQSLTVVATARVPFGIAGEQVVPIGPLEDMDEAAAMFLDRAALLSSSPTSDGEAISVARRIAADLDGIPLAIELAAAQSGLYSLPEIETRLKERLPFLRGGTGHVEPRHARLEEVLGWSIDSLPEESRKVFTMLSSFYGSFTVESASAVYDGSIEPHIEVLLRRALIVRVRAAQTRRFRMLQTVREAAELHQDPSTAKVYLARLCQYLSEFCNRQENLFRSSETAAQGHILLSEELENIRGAMAAALNEDSEIGLAMAIRHAIIGAALGHVQEVRRWLESYLLTRSWEDSRTVCRGYFHLAIAVGFYGEEELELEYLRRSSAIAQAIGDQTMDALSGTNLSLNLLWSNRFSEARVQSERCLTIWPESEHSRIMNELIIVRADGLSGNLKAARAAMQNILEHRLSFKDIAWTLSEAWFGVAQLELEAGDYESAVSSARSGTEVLQGGGYSAMASDTLGFLARVLVAAGHTDEAWEVIRQLDSLGGNQGIPIGTMFANYFTGVIDSDRGALVEATRIGVKLTRFAVASRALQALATLVDDGDLASQLLGAAAELRRSHNIELSVSEGAEWDAIASRIGVFEGQPEALASLLRRVKR